MISFKIDPALKKLVQRLAEEESRNLTSFITNCIVHYLKTQKGIDWYKSKSKKKPSKK